MGQERIIILTGGAFNGKSIISLAIASHFRFSGVISTDTIRNALNAECPNAEYLRGSTYFLSEDNLQKQREVISNTIKKMIDIYKEYGERIVIEGMHFSKDFMLWAASQSFHTICIHNLLPLTERVILKSITRAQLSLYDPITSERIYGAIDKTNVKQSVYMQHQERIGHIQSTILNCSKECGFEIIEFDQIDDGIAKAIRSVGTWLGAASLYCTGDRAAY